MNIKGFFQDIDCRWAQPAPGKIRLGIIGSAALLLQTDYDRGTKDSDILEALDLTPGIKRGLQELAGQGSDIHKRIGSTWTLCRAACHFSRRRRYSIPFTRSMRPCGISRLRRWMWWM
ncbi:MAG: hypothetical protein Q7R35_04155 [Elusimicrobiota bacterium]|nr:hypothetical protein [Elusimicrobiota bacterium]